MKRFPPTGFLATSVVLLLAALATCRITSACSLAIIPISVGPSFQVKVSADDGPVKGLLLEVTAPNGPTHSAVTDENGIASFHYLAKGTYYLGADHGGGYGAQLDVKPHGPANITVPMKWPFYKPIRVRSLSGTMRAPDAVPGRLPQRVLSLELLEGISGRVLASIDATDRGAFDFGKLTPGLYFIRLKPYTAFFGRVGGLIGLAVDPAAPARAEKLDLNLTWTSCGLTYTDQSQCPQPDLHVNKLEGHATGSMERAPHRLEIILLDDKQNPAVHVSTDQNGDFSYTGPLEGKFELWIEGGAIIPVHTPLYIEPTADASSLQIQAGYLAGCTTVRVK